MKEPIHPALAKMLAARNFPINTCPASRHAAEIGEAMITHEDEVMMLIDDFEHAGESILLTVAALWEARSRLQATSDLMDEDALRQQVSDLIKQAGSQKAAAQKMGCSLGYLNDYLHGRRAAGDKILSAFGLKRVVLYASQPPGKPESMTPP